MSRGKLDCGRGFQILAIKKAGLTVFSNLYPSSNGWGGGGGGWGIVRSAKRCRRCILGLLYTPYLRLSSPSEIQNQPPPSGPQTNYARQKIFK